jgi:hypothetical protein
MAGTRKRGVWYFRIVVGSSGAATDGVASSVRNMSNEMDTDKANGNVGHAPDYDIVLAPLK